MKKVYLIASLLLANTLNAQTQEKEVPLKCDLLRRADNAGIFHTPIIDILKTRFDIMHLVQGVKEWSGAIMQAKIANSNNELTIYCRRPEIINGATFIALAPDHELAKSIATPEYSNAVNQFIDQHLLKNNAIGQHKSLYDRQMESNNDAIFTGSYAINPFTQELLPIYVSDFAIECFDIRHSKVRLGVPAHNSKDLEFAKLHHLPIKLVVDVQRHIQGKKDDLGPVVAAPLLDKKGNLTEAYLGEYSACIVTNSGTLNDLSLKEAAHQVINYLEAHGCGCAHSEILQYRHNNQLYSIMDLAKIETTIYKNNLNNSQIDELKKELQITLNYMHADFFDIVEKFIINLKNTKALMIVLAEEFCELRGLQNSYLLRWSQLKSTDDEKHIFRRDITSIKELTVFCKDLVKFLSDFANSCPKALDNIRKQN